MFDKTRLPFVVLDVICVALAGSPGAVLTARRAPFQRGLFCGDASVRYPYREDTVSQRRLAGLVLPVGAAVLVAGEALAVRHARPGPCKGCAAAVYKALGAFVFGAAAGKSVTDIAKHAVGRLRPHFVAVCRPDWARVNCSAGYVEALPCLGDQAQVREGRLSFYSGHASFAMYCMLFLALYLQARMRADWARLLRPTLQAGLLAAAFYVGLSQVSDYKHHWGDVLAGFVQGALVAVLTVALVADFFQAGGPAMKEEKEEDSHPA